MDLKNWRQEYNKYHLDEHELGSEPFLIFNSWFERAKQDGHTEPNAMVLATCGASGMPDCRMLLLKEVKDQNFIFYSNYQSAKAKDLEYNPKATILFYWEHSQRQVRISGEVRKGSREESEAYFSSRPYNSQLSAVASAQSTKTTKEALLASVKKAAESDVLICPKNWGAYRLSPTKFEFWQGQPGRLHDRILFELYNNSWTQSRLAP